MRNNSRNDDHLCDLSGALDRWLRLRQVASVLLG